MRIVRISVFVAIVLVGCSLLGGSLVFDESAAPEVSSQTRRIIVSVPQSIRADDPRLAEKLN